MADNPRIEELRRRVQADPASIAFAALAEEFRRARRYPEAIETCRTGLQRHPSYLSARVTLGRSLVEVGEFVEAKEVLEHVLRAAPENLAAIRALAEIHERQGKSPEALEEYHEALSAMAAAQAAEAAAEPAEPAAPAPAPVPLKVSAPPVAPEPVAAIPPPPVAAAPAKVPLSVSTPVATLDPIPVSPPRGHAKTKALEELEQFLASIQAARRSVPRDNSGVAAR
jgi:tetratricopeptide (TPR) repeat protein